MNGDTGIIPPGFVEEVDRLLGERGRAWLTDLPALLECTLRELSLRVDGAARHGAHGLVLPVRHGADRLALKIAFPDAVTVAEVAGLQAWNGHGTVLLIDANPSAGILLMEWLDSSRDLTTLPLDEAVHEAARLARRLAVPAPTDISFPTTSERAREIAATLPAMWELAGRPFAESRLQRTMSLADSLADGNWTSLATWDLHSENVLWGERAGWTMIDPMPLVGDAEIALAPFLWTRTEEISGPNHLRQLLEGYVTSGEFSLDRTRDWLTVRLADYWLWGRNVGLTIDPERCRLLLDWLDPLPDIDPR